MVAPCESFFANAIAICNGAGEFWASEAVDGGLVALKIGEAVKFADEVQSETLQVHVLLNLSDYCFLMSSD